MFAVVETGGKQYKVELGSVISVEKLAGNPGDKLELGKVLMFTKDGSVKAGKDAGVKVTAEIVGQIKSDKVLIFKKKRRHNYRRKNGHRQNLTTVKVTAIG